MRAPAKLPARQYGRMALSGRAALILLAVSMFLFFSSCNEIEYYLEIIIAAGQGSTTPAPGIYGPTETPDITMTATPASGWRLLKIVVTTDDEAGYSGGERVELNYGSETAKSLVWDPGNVDEERYTKYEVYFEQIPDGPFKLEIEATLENGSPGGGNVTCDNDNPDNIPEGTEVELACAPLQGYQFVRWDIYTKDANSAWVKVSSSTLVNPKVTMNSDMKAVAVFKSSS